MNHTLFILSFYIFENIQHHAIGYVHILNIFSLMDFEVKNVKPPYQPALFFIDVLH
jgi:hypothetical protein